MRYDIRRVTKMDEVRAVVELTRQIWSMSEKECPSAYLMKAVTRFGLVLAAYSPHTSPPAPPVGFIYSLPKNSNSHHSHMMGVHPDHQHRGLGFELKRAHRRWALDHDPPISTIEWTFDPLIAPNAYLNLRKLGGFSNTFLPDYYGFSDDSTIYPALPTDRILIEWSLKHPRVVRRLESAPSGQEVEQPVASVEDLFHWAPVLTAFNAKSPLLSPPAVISQHLAKLLDEPFVAVEVPSSFVKDTTVAHQSWGMDWRSFFKVICEHFFGHGFYLADYFSFSEKALVETNSVNKRRNFFLYVRNIHDYQY